MRREINSLMWKKKYTYLMFIPWELIRPFNWLEAFHFSIFSLLRLIFGWPSKEMWKVKMHHANWKVSSVSSRDEKCHFDIDSVLNVSQGFVLETPPNLEGELNYAGNLTTIASSRARCDFLIFSSFLDDDKSPYERCWCTVNLSLTWMFKNYHFSKKIPFR